MAEGPWTFPTAAYKSILDGTFAITGDTYKCALFTQTKTAQNCLDATDFATFDNTGEVSETNTGYTAGGASVDLIASSANPSVVSWAADPQWTAGSANLTAKWAVVYEVAGNVLCYADLNTAGATSDVTATSGNTFTVQQDPTDKLFSLAPAA